MKLLTLSASLLGLFLVFGLFGSGPDYSAPEEEGTTLRIIATEEMPYVIEWEGGGWGSDGTEGSVPEGEAYVDYPVPDSAFEDDAIRSIRVETADGAASWQQEGSLGAILYVEGEYADCSHAAARSVPFSDVYTGIPSVVVGWSGDPQETGGMSKRLTCGLYRWYT